MPEQITDAELHEVLEYCEIANEGPFPTVTATLARVVKALQAANVREAEQKDWKRKYEWLIEHDKDCEAEVLKWRRIRTPTHGPCCTCQGCGLYYDECRCDLDEVADELEQRKAENDILKVQVTKLEKGLREFETHETTCNKFQSALPYGSTTCNCKYSDGSARIHALLGKGGEE